MLLPKKRPTITRRTVKGASELTGFLVIVYAVSMLSVEAAVALFGAGLILYGNVD